MVNLLLTRTVLNMKEDDLTYRGEIHLDLTQTDAMFQDANRNFSKMFVSSDTLMHCLTLCHLH